MVRSMTRHARRRLAALALGTVLVVGACGDDDDTTSTGVADTSTASTVSTPTGAATASTATDDTSADVSAVSTTGDGAVTTTAADGDHDPDATLRVSWTVPPTGLDPHKINNVTGPFPYVTQLYDRLTYLGNGPELQPMLATGWEFSDDALTLTFTLRDDVTFHDGTALDSAAVKASLDRARELPESTVKQYFQMVDSIEAPDPSTVVITTNRPAADLPYTLSGAVGSIINPNALDTDLETTPAGSGPYELQSITIGDRATFSRAADYWDPDAQKAAVVEISGITDDNARLSALRSGEIDVMYAKLDKYADVSQLDTDEFGFVSYPPANTFSLFVNSARAPLDDLRVRQALNFAIDRQAISDTIMQGQCPPLDQPLPASYEGHVDDLEDSFTYDPDRARELLAEAGYADGLQLTLLHGVGISPQDAVATAVQAQLADVGINVEVTALEQAEGVTAWRGGEFDLYSQSRVGQPNGALFYRENFITNVFNLGELPPEFVDAVDQGLDPRVPADELTDLVQTATRSAVDNALEVAICERPVQLAYAKYVTGVDTMGMSDVNVLFDTRYLGVLEH